MYLGVHCHPALLPPPPPFPGIKFEIFPTYLFKLLDLTLGEHPQHIGGGTLGSLLE